MLIDTLERPYADIRLVRRGGELGYRASMHGQHVGYFLTLRAACREAHLAFVRAHGHQGSANGTGYPEWETTKAAPHSEE